MEHYLYCCRLCMNQNNPLEDYNMETNGEKSCFTKINEIMSTMLLNTSESLPQLICFSCKNLLNVTYNFITECFKHKKILDQYIYDNVPQQYQNKRKIQRVLKSNKCHQNEKKLTKNHVNTTTKPVVNCLDNEMKLTENIANTSVSEDNTSDNVYLETVFVKSEPDYDHSNEESFQSDPLTKQVHQLPLIKTEEIHLDSDDFDQYNDTGFEETPLSSTEDSQETYEPNPPSQLKQFVCKTCNKSFSHLKNLKRHEHTHSGERPFACNICDKRFSLAHHLKIHEHVHTGAKPHVCGVCGKSFTMPVKLKVHERTHTGEKPFQCKVCNKGFTQLHSKNTHERSHLQQKEAYVCQTCNKQFKAIGNLRQHERSHLNEKPHVCEVCNKSFIMIERLRIHQRIHTGEKPFTCKICDESFVQAVQLKRHNRIHVGEKHDQKT